MEREKSVLKQGAVQHLYARLAATLSPDKGDADLLVRPQPVDGPSRKETQVIRKGGQGPRFGWQALRI